MEFIEYDSEILKHIHNVEIMILNDFINLCDNNNINYYLFYGTQIGAVRHQGFIPWDDDIDIIMFRNDYEKFLKIFEKNGSDKYEMLDCRYISDYFFQFGKLSLKGTHTPEKWDNQISYKTGIHIDLFILDTLPNNAMHRYFYIRWCFILNKLYALSTIRMEGHFIIIQFIFDFIYMTLNVLGFTPFFFQKHVSKTFRKYEFLESDFVADLTLNEKLVFNVDDFESGVEVNFEHIVAKIPKNSDAILTKIYGNYMELPPEDERFNHALNFIDFGKY